MTVLAVIVYASLAAAQSPVGALAIDARHGDQHGGAVDYGTAAVAQGRAPKECGPGCSLVLTFGRCTAYAADQDADSTAVGWAESFDSAAGARQAALSECGSRAGSGCTVRVWGCNGSVVEEGLGLNRAVRRQIQQGLRSEGFDPGGADGQFGPRTRAATRNWQSARGARGTGYLDAAAATAPQSAAVARFQVAEAATAFPQSTPATAAQENLFWQSIMNSPNPADFEGYLGQFPNGVFRRPAENRLPVLRAQPAGTPSGGAPRMGSPTTSAADARLPTPRLVIDFGNDTCEWVQDGECYDPPFAGDGMVLPESNSSERGRDARDCRRLYEAGRIRLFDVDPDSGSVDFGDDTSAWTPDGECDDPRFEGDGMGRYHGWQQPWPRPHRLSPILKCGPYTPVGVDIGGVRLCGLLLN